MRSICTSIVATLVLAGMSFAATINVPADYTTIQAAVNAASNGDEILVAPGTYTGTGDEVVNTLGKPITIRATGTPEETIIDGEGARRVVHCNSSEGPDTIIEGFTITGGSANYGGGIYCYSSSPTISDCTIANNTASSYGGGISCDDGSSPTINGCTIANNTTNSGGGGIFCSGGTPTITDCTISTNTANLGGGIYSTSSSSPTISGCTITDNTTNGNGGGIFCDSSTISGCTISSNSADDRGGGIYCPGGSPTINGCTISTNTAANSGGGIYCTSSSPTITDCTISDNTAVYGGGISSANSSGPTIVGTNFSGNNANTGGGIYLTGYGSTIIVSCLFSGNTAVVVGGLYADLDPDFVAYISYSTFCENTLPQLNGNWSDDGENLITELCGGLGACCTGNQSWCVAASETDCEYFGGMFMGYGVECADVSCPTSCLGDVNGDGEVSVNDILTVVANWGPCP